MIDEILNLKEKIDQKIFRLVGISLISILLLTIAVLLFAKESTPVPELYSVQRGDLEVTITEVGEIQALNNFDVRLPGSELDRRRYWRGSSSNRAQIIYLIPEGTRAEIGDTLVQMDISGIQTEREQLVEQLLTAQQAYDDEVSNQALLRRQDIRSLQDVRFTLESRRLEKELAQFSSPNEQEQKDLQLQMAVLDSIKLVTKIKGDNVVREFKLDKLKTDVEEYQRRIEGIDQRIESYTIIAEYPAIVVYYDDRRDGKVKVGDSPYPGQVLLQLPDLSSLTAVIDINDLDRANVWEGQSGKVKMEAYPNTEFTGSVIGLSPISQSSQTELESNVKIFEVLFKLDDTDERFRPGMTASLDLVVDKVENTLLIPLSAVFETDGKLYVYRYENDSQQMQEITVGKRNAIMAEVTSGLDEGSMIVRNKPAASGFKPGQSMEWEKQQNAIAMLDEHFQAIEELGIQYDYDENRRQTRQIEYPENNAPSADEPSEAQIERILGRMNLEDTPENRKRISEMIRQRREAGGNQDFQRSPENNQRGRDRNRQSGSYENHEQ